MPSSRSSRDRRAHLRQLRTERQHLQALYHDLFAQVNRLVHSHDPVGIAFVGDDEYEPEVGTILPRLREVQTLDDMRRIVYETFVFWFDTASGPEERYQPLANDLWEWWQHYRGPRP
jgi:hypothetical protein